jgi:predicted RND superfamily exporter protein
MSIEGIFRATACFSTRRPRTVLGAALVLVALSVGFAASRLELRTSNLDLIDPNLPEVRRFLDFAARFGTPNLLVVVLEGADEERLHQAGARVETALVGSPGVERVLGRLPFDDDTLELLDLSPWVESDDGGLLFVFVQPQDPYSQAATIEPFVLGVRARLAEARLDDLGVHAGLTGMPVYALDDRDVVRHDVSRLSLLSLVLVVGLFFAAFRSFRRPALAALALLVGVGLTVGLATIYPGHLTLLSAFFAAILFGLGIDYGIHLVGRVEELIGEGQAEIAAIPTAAAGVGRGLLTGAATTALIFLAMNLSGFRGFAELGTIAAIGVAACLAAAITVLPALLALGRRAGARTAGSRGGRIGQLLLRLQSGPLAVALALLALAGLAGGPGFDADYLALQPRGSEAVRLEREMVRRSDLSPAFAAFVVPSREQAFRLTDRLLASPVVGEVRSIVDLDEIAASAATPVELPESFRAAFRSASGELAVYAYPDGDIWDRDFQRRFVGAMKEIDPTVTGMPMLGSFMVDRSRRALIVTALLGGAILACCLLVDFRSPRLALLAGLPAALTATSMLALMRLLGLSFNPLNVMALPVVLGVAVDDGVHIVHRFVAEGGDVRRTLTGTGRSVLLTSATTLAAFGTLAFSSHRGLASFATALALGVGAAVLLSVLVLPSFLAALAPRALRPAVAGDGARRDGERQRARKRGIALSALVGCLLCAPLGAAEPAGRTDRRNPVDRQGDAAWLERAAGFREDGHVAEEPALRALASYEEALSADPDNLDLSFKTIEALYFAGHFAVPDAKRRRELASRQLELAERTVSRVESAAGPPDPDGGRLTPTERAERVRGIPGARRAYFWSAISWGVWGMSHGYLASARRGVAARIRDRAATLVEIDETFAEAGGLRLLGRLHCATPRVPFVTGWIDRREGLELLRRANRISQQDPRNPLFLAEAILDHEPERSAEALALLREVVGRSPDPDQLVEQSEILAQARQLLARAETEEER